MDGKGLNSRLRRNDKKNMPLEELPAEDVLALMDAADARALDEVKKARRKIAAAAKAAASAIGGGGRLIYVGAGTSGRLGVLDASECQPTFSANPRQVVGIIAGGRKALTSAVEGAEDDRDAGREAIAKIKAGPGDMVVGITASGTTPFVIAAIEEANARGSDCWLFKCTLTPSDPRSARVPRSPTKGRGVKVIAINTGKEVVQGSSRLAAGTATKLVLNRITTAAFVMLGKVYGDLMVDVMPTNAKLVKRAAGIITSISGCSEAKALNALEESGWKTKTAALMAARGVGRAEAERLLKEHKGFLRRAMDKAN